MSVWSAMTYALFAGPLADDAQLSGITCRAVVSRGVAIIGEYGETVGHRTVVSLPTSQGAQVGDVLAIGTLVDGVFQPTETVVLDVPKADDGQVAEFVVRPA